MIRIHLKAKRRHTKWCVFFLAEWEGFEPSRRFWRPTPLAGEPLRPLGYHSESISYSLDCQSILAQADCFVKHQKSRFRKRKAYTWLLTGKMISFSTHGEMSERFKEPVLKTGDGATHRGFESHSLRQITNPTPCGWDLLVHGYGIRTIKFNCPADSCFIPAWRNELSNLSNPLSPLIFPLQVGFLI